MFPALCPKDGNVTIEDLRSRTFPCRKLAAGNLAKRLRGSHCGASPDLDRPRLHRCCGKCRARTSR
eukprot:4741597-Pyramimonas_sp.AAC.1